MTVRQISILDDATVDQIAAGEVVERPASVVKELVENSLDAGATRVHVDIRQGGTTWIGVTDNGHGMSPEDARLSLQRHATSKLDTASDLERIGSFGFRGEALPSIASVSRFRLVTRPQDASEACEIRASGGTVEESRSIGAPFGTRIEVADLFAQVPARRKFLKKPSTEWGHIADWLARLALVLPAVHFEIRRDDRAPQIWPATENVLDRIAAVLSEEEASALIAATGNNPAGELRAFISAPEWTRPNTSSIHLFVNGRPVRDRLIRHALLQSYRDLLPRGRFPSALLYLSVEPESVDVNVHPAKWEVRFSDPQAIHQLVRRTVRAAMEERTWLGLGAGSNAELASAGSDQVADSQAENLGGGWNQPPPGANRLFESPLSRTRESEASGRQSEPTASGEANSQSRASFGDQKLLGQLLASYLLLEGPDGLVLVDQHAAHERVLYERLRSQWLLNGVEKQALLISENIDLDIRGTAVLADSDETVQRLGFEIESFGETAVIARAVPAILAGQNPTLLIRELVAELAVREPERAGAIADTRMLSAADRVFASLACHSARRAGDHLQVREQQSLLDELDTIPWAPTCPHGRPVAINLPRGEIEHRFRRR